MRRIVIEILVLCLFIFLFLRWFERANLWAPTHKFYADPSVVDLAYEDIYFETEDGVKLNGWYVSSEKPVAAMLFCHGNGGNISYRTESLRQFNTLNLNVFLFDYRGYGKSKGWLTEDGTYRDAAAAYRWLKKKNPDLPIILFGRSLGANIAADLATKVDAAALIYESGFNSVQDMGSELFPFLPVRWITKYQYNGLEKIKHVKAPILVVHSQDDEVIPYHHGKKLFETAPEPKRFLEITGGHNDGFILSEEIYLRGIRDFLDEMIVNEKIPTRLNNAPESGSIEENQ
jgi:uncharacterized protein